MIGRGAVDMKGFVACVLACVPDLVSRKLARPVHIALSYDEEVGCVGVRHLIARLSDSARSRRCIVGEPTVCSRCSAQGKIATRHGRRQGRAFLPPDLGDNAIIMPRS